MTRDVKEPTLFVDYLWWTLVQACAFSIPALTEQLLMVDFWREWRTLTCEYVGPDRIFPKSKR